MVKNFVVVLLLALMFLEGASNSVSAENAAGKILAVTQKMISAVEDINDFISEVEVIYYKDGKESRKYRLTFFYKKEGKIRVNFSHPFPGVTVFYNGSGEKLTVRPVRFLPIKLNFSIDNFMVKTPSGQRIDQTDVRYFIRFLFSSLKWIKEKENEFSEGKERVEFFFWAMDYVEGKNLEKYQVIVSKNNWLPMRIERYNFEGKPIEIIVFKKYIINPFLKDTFFIP